MSEFNGVTRLGIPSGYNSAVQQVSHILTNGPYSSIAIAKDLDSSGVVNSVVELLRLDTRSITTVQDGVGSALNFYHRNDADEETKYVSMEFIATDVSNGSEDGKIVFKTMQGGTLTEAFVIDTTGTVSVGTNLSYSGAGTLTMVDNSATAFVIQEGANAYINLATTNSSELIGMLKPTSFGVDDTGVDVTFHGATTAVNVQWDESADSMIYKDNAKHVYGSGSDVTARWDGTDFDWLAAADDSVMKFGNGTNNFDIHLMGETNDLIWDASAQTLIAQDGVKIAIGTGADLTIAWDGTDCDILQATANSSIKFGVDGAGIDIVQYGDTAGTTYTWDQSADAQIASDNVKTIWGTGSDVTARWDGTDFDWLAAADDSVMKFGNGTQSFDVWIYGNVAGNYLLWDASLSTLSLQGSTAIKYQNVTKTTNYTVTAAEFGAHLNTTGASGAVTFTLPAASGNAGAECWFHNTVDQNMVIAGQTGELVGLNDAAADTLTFSTSSELIGAGAYAYCDGAKWNVYVLGTATGVFA